MRNLTLSMPDELLNKSREYAEKHGTTINEMVRQYLKKTVVAEKSDFNLQLEALRESIHADTKDSKFNREEIYERKNIL